ncbi:MAG: hypothetical protein ACXWLS_12365, partial [Myxococcaceae bacterium]
MTASVDERHGRALGWYRLPLGLVFTLGAVALLVTLSVPLIFGNLCAKTLHDEFKAPDGRRAALVFDIDCGATTAFNAQVSILPRSPLVPAGSTALDRGNGD